MALRLARRVALPAHAGDGGFGGAALHAQSGRLYVAHPANNCVDVLDARLDLYLYSVPGVRGAAGVLVAAELGEVFAGAQGEGKLAFFQSGDRSVETMLVGRKPSRLAWDASRQTLWVGRGDARSWGVTVVDFARSAVCGELPVPSAPAGMVYDDARDAAYLAPTGVASMLVVDGHDPLRVARAWALPAPARALAVGAAGGWVYAAGEDGGLLALDTASGNIATHTRLPGPAGAFGVPPGGRRIYASLPGEGVLAALDATTMELLQTVETEPGAETVVLDAARNKLSLLCPGSCAVLVFRDG